MNSRKVLLNRIMTSDIILFGAGDYARQFYREFRDVVHLAGCISNNPSESVFSVDGVDVCPVIRVEDYIKKEIKGAFIICASASSNDMESQLWMLGLIQGEQFCSSEIARLILTEKKIAIVYGVCYMRAIHDCLKESKSFLRDYQIYYSLSYMTRSAFEDSSLKFLISLCDLYLHNFSLSPDQRRKQQELIRFLSLDAKTITVPIIQSSALYPQAGDISQWTNPYGIVSSKTRWGPFTNPDHNINKYLEQGTKPETILKEISRADYYDVEFLKSNYEKELIGIEISESGSDIIISDFIRNNCGKKRLFMNASHISNEVIIELAIRILRKLGMEEDIPRGELLKHKLINSSEVPLYPSVIRGLELEVYFGDPLYRMFTFGEEEYVSFEEYVIRYCDFCSNMMRFKKMGYFP